MSWWTDERVDETVTSAYVHSHLRPNEQELLQRALYFGGDLTDDTYLDWILTRAKRFFLILVATGVPDQIFGVVDDSYDDEDLPIIERAVPDLRLSYEPDRSLDKRFYKNQFRFLTRVVGEGEHIRYAEEETVPIIPISLKSVVLSLSSESTDRVRLPTDMSKVLIRRRVALEPPVTEENILNEIAASRKLCHEHIVSVFGSYLHQGTFNVLSLPTAEWTLKTFLTDPPKSFNALPKTERRLTLINWPHCLANALSWLHENGEFHGAIRPSNIQVDESFRISLGLLDGEGLLRDTVRSDDIEVYQYGPPERWKRAVTVQSIGSATMSLPSGGRSGRKTGGGDRWNGSEGKNSVRSRSSSSATTYTFKPTSRGGYARFRLSAAMSPDTPPQPTIRGRNMRSPTDNRSISTQDTARAPFDPAGPRRPPSIMSCTSSNGQQSGSMYNNAIFVSAPEGRSAVVQTWQSVEQDMFASDVFSLGAVIMDILNLLCKRSYGAFSRHRSSKNRMAGRGGGLADASFHANLRQVFLWAQTLQLEAEKKAKKDESQVFHAVGPVVQLTLQCLERDPQARLTSQQLEKKIDDHIRRFTNVTRLHCTAERSKESTAATTDIPIRAKDSSNQALRETRSADRLRQPSPNPRTLAPEWGQPQQQHIPPDGPILESPITHTSPSVTTTPGASSVNSLLSFNFDGISDTVVGESPHSREQSLRRPSRRGEAPPPMLQHEGPWPNERDTSKRAYWNNWHNNDSQVDPRLSFGESVDTGAFTYLNYSTSASSEEGVKYFPRPPPSDPPPKAPPNRELPPVPPLPTKTRSAKPRQHLGPLKTSANDLAVLNQLSKAATGGHPVQLDSLPKMLDHDYDDYHDIIRHTRRPHTAKAASRSRSRQDPLVNRSGA